MFFKCPESPLKGVSTYSYQCRIKKEPRKKSLRFCVGMRKARELNCEVFANAFRFKTLLGNLHIRLLALLMVRWWNGSVLIKHDNFIKLKLFLGLGSFFIHLTSSFLFNWHFIWTFDTLSFYGRQLNCRGNVQTLHLYFHFLPSARQNYSILWNTLDSVPPICMHAIVKVQLTTE